MLIAITNNIYLIRKSVRIDNNNIIIIISTAKAATDLQNLEDHNKSINKDLVIEKAELEHHMKHGKHIVNKSM
jgi:hypothetical protein